MIRYGTTAAGSQRWRCSSCKATTTRRIGNSAKLREALEELVANIEMRASVFGIFSIIDRKTFLDAKAALAEPPRNCDVYDAKTAEKEFVRQTGSTSIRSKSVRWLYAPAAEQEGGEK